MVHSGVLYISERRRPPKRRGARGSLPPYSTLDGPGSTIVQLGRS